MSLDPGDIDQLRTYDRALSDAAEGILPLLGSSATPMTLDGLRQGVAELRRETAEESKRLILEQIRRLADAPVPDTGPDLLAGCRRQIARLCELESPLDDEDLRLAEGLVALVQLNEASTEDERSALTERAMELLPADCQAAVGSAAFGNLHLSPTDEPTAPPVREVVADEPSPASAAPGVESTEPDGLPTSTDEDDLGSTEKMDLAPPSGGEPAFGSEQALPEAENIAVEDALRTLLEQRRFGLAYWVASAWSQDDPALEHALKAIAYAAVLRSSAGDSAGRFRELIESVPLDSLKISPTASVLALAAGLRGTLLAPYSGAGDLLVAVVNSYAEFPALASLVAAVTTAGQRGLSAADMSQQVQNLVGVEDSLRAVQDRAKDMLRLSTIKYARASNVWRNWIDPEGLLGPMLHAVAERRMEPTQASEEAVIALRNAKTLERKLDETDRRLRTASSQRHIWGDARKKLVERAEESLTIVADWIEVSRELERVRQKEASESWQKDLLENLRAAARQARTEVKEIWLRWSKEQGLRGAAADGTLPLIEEVFALVLDGERPVDREGPVEEILGLDLLRVRGLGLDERLEPTDEPNLEALLGAVHAGDWESAFEERVGEGNFDAAKRIVGIIGREDEGLGGVLERHRQSRLTEKRDGLDGRHAELERRLGAARREGRVSDSDGLNLASRLAGLTLQPDQKDFRGSDPALDKFSADLKQAEREGLSRAKEAYEPRLENEARLLPYRDRLRALLEGGEISTLEELVLAIEREEELPEEAGLIFRQLTSFFPVVPADPQVRRAFQDVEALESAVRNQQRFGALDFASLKDEEIDLVLSALAAWRRIECADFTSVEEDLDRILDVIGLTVEGGIDPRQWRRRRAEKRHRAEIVAKPLGKALIPAFGSDVPGGRYRMLMIWERVSDDAIAALISQEVGEQPILVLFFGSALPENVRRGVADQLRHQPNRRAVALIDGPAFLYLASKGGRNLATTMRITLPFSAVNPYTPFAPGSVPLEMFYGRDRELSGVIDRNGTSFIYGGRRLGKSALLRAAERKFASESPGNRAFYIDLKTKGVGEREPPGKIVVEIARALKDGIMTANSAKAPTFDDIRMQVHAWIEGDSNRRILLLLDECDSFLNEDAKEGFANVTELKALMEETDRRFKPVFAGLHQVRRFERIPNQPLAHLGYPTPVGPLKPQPAYDLITKPLEALGLRFDTPDLPTRILTATNYQPSLIQLLCNELVDYMLMKACGPDTPPYIVTSQDVEAVHQTPRVIEEMRTRFELTTNLDPRYRVIANSVAFDALESEDGTPGLRASDIKAMCEEYWPVGFAKTGTDEFRSLLEEMDSLGILFTDRTGHFRMRSPNVLRMLGTAEQIEEHLKASNELDLPLGFEAASFRDSLGGDPHRRQPLTHEQVAGLMSGEAWDDEDLEGKSNLRIIVGTMATGIEDVMPCLEELFEDGSGRFSFKDQSSLDPKRLRGRFKGAPKKKRRVVAYKLKEEPRAALALIRSIDEKIAMPEARSTAIFVLDGDSLKAWESLIAGPDSLLGGPDPDGAVEQLEVVELKRWSKPGLRAWAQAQDVDLIFNEDRALNELIAVTGGWPMLVDRVVESYIKNHDWRAAIKRLENWLESVDGAESFCDAVGLTADSYLADTWNLFIVYGEPLAREELPQLAEVDGIEDATRCAELLRSMQVLELDSKGRFVVEATVARAWRSTKASTAVVDAAP